MCPRVRFAAWLINYSGVPRQITRKDNSLLLSDEETVGSHPLSNRVFRYRAIRLHRVRLIPKKSRKSARRWWQTSEWPRRMAAAENNCFFFFLFFSCCIISSRNSPIYIFIIHRRSSPFLFPISFFFVFFFHVPRVFLLGILLYTKLTTTYFLTSWFLSVTIVFFFGNF